MPRQRPVPRRPRAGRRSWWGQLTRRGRRLVVGAVSVLVLLAGAVGGGMGLASWLNSSIRTANLLGSDRTDAGGTVTGPLNMLVIGSNFRTEDPSNGERADTIMIVHVTKDLKHAFLISVPRDLYTTIRPDHTIAPNYDGSTEKIDAALTYGGVPLLAKTVSNLVGVRFDGAVEARFDGFQQAVKDLGGVCMYVDEETTSVHVGYNDSTGKEQKPYSNTGSHPIPVPGVTPVTYHVGYQCLKPWQALDFVRQRELLPNGDYDRQRHQQQFIAAVLKQTASSGTLSDPVKLHRVLTDIGKGLTVDTNGVPVSDLGWALHDLRSQDLTGLRPPSHPTEINGTDYVRADPGSSDLWRALRSDSLARYVRAHPELVNPLQPSHPAG